MATIELTQGKVAIVDDADFDWLSRFKWCFASRYAITSTTHISMAKMILGVGRESKVIWRNSDTLDNRRENLLAGTWTHSRRHKRKSPNPKSSRHKGVSYEKDRDLWRASIYVPQRIHLGRFADEDAAGQAYDDAACEHFGDFARLNFPGGKRAR